MGEIAVHESQVVLEQPQWRPNTAWITLAIFVLLFSLLSNLYEFVAANILRSTSILLVAHPLDRFFDDTARLLMCGVGLVLLLRANGRRSSFALGIGLAGLAAFPVTYFFADSGTALAADFVFQIVTGPVAWLIPAFVISMMRENGMPTSRLVSWIFWIGFFLTLLVTSSFYIPELIGLSKALLSIGLALAPHFFAMVLLLIGWSRGDREQAHRFILLFLAVSLIISANLLFSIFYNGTGIYPRPVTNTASAVRIIGSLLFAYAILRYRVIDIGFTINRTLVYGSVSLILLATFGLLEWGAHHLLQIEGKETSPLIDAGLAVTIFLAFHPVRDFVEHYVERWFFYSWQKAEIQLKRFVASAGHFNSKPVLCEAFVRELSHYAEGTEAALYIAHSGGVYTLTAGGLTGANERYEDNTAIALMRSEREPIDLTHGDVALPGALALPMLDQSVLIGFALLASKPDGSHYRPDELENLGWAAHQIGLDLQALHARELEEHVAKLIKLNDSLEEKNRLLMTLIEKRRPAIDGAGS